MLSKQQNQHLNSAALLPGIFAVLLLAPNLSLADCSTDPERFKIKYPNPEKIVAARNKFFAAECNGEPSDLFDSTDPKYQGQFKTDARGSSSQKGDHYPDAARRKHHEGATTVAYVIEKSGDITTVAILDSSGYDDLDQGTAEGFKQVHYQHPATLDGKPVRLIIYTRVDWRLTRGSH